MNPLSDALARLGLPGVWGYLALFLAASLLMIWRLEALLAHRMKPQDRPCCYVGKPPVM